MLQFVSHVGPYHPASQVHAPDAVAPHAHCPCPLQIAPVPFAARGHGRSHAAPL
jgi:hypothetical protein